MTTFTKAELPSTIATVEQLVVWGTMVLTAANGTKKLVEATNTYPVPVAEWNTFQSPADGLRQLCRVNIQMDEAVGADNSKKFWMFAKELTGGNIGAVYTTN
jgi:hypothetical protein